MRGDDMRGNGGIKWNWDWKMKTIVCLCLLLAVVVPVFAGAAEAII